MALFERIIIIIVVIISFYIIYINTKKA